MASEYLTIEHLNLKEIRRIFTRVRIGPESWNGTYCWMWTGYTREAGYARVRLNYAYIYFHRLMYAWLVGPIPFKWTRLQLDHLCRNQSCGNPVHLELVTPAVNTGRFNALRTHCKRGHPFDDCNTYWDSKNNERQCKECRRNAKRRYRARCKELQLPYS